jgi:FkbM family methyltransferase
MLSGRMPQASGSVTRAAEFGAWMTLALCLATLGGFDALSRLLSDHDNLGDSDYAAMAAAWLALAGWAAARSLDALPARGGVRRRWCITALLLAALPYSAMFETDLAFTLNACLLSLALAFVLTRIVATEALPAGFRVRGGGNHPRGSPAIADQREWQADERKIRDSFFSKAAEFTAYVTVEAEDQLFFVATEDSGIGRPLFVKRTRGDIRHLGTAVRLLAQVGLSSAGSTFVDVGANIGTTTVTALRRYEFARAVALEPAPANFRLLRHNLLANNIESAVTALHVAVTEAEGEQRLVLSGASSGAHVLAPAVPNKPASAVMVQAVTLDGLVARGVIDPAAVGLLWIDTVGHEADVLAGASVLVSAGVPLVVALRTRSERWPKKKGSLLRLLAGYTDFAELRVEARLTRDLSGLLNAIEKPGTDLLAVRRLRSQLCSVSLSV